MATQPYLSWEQYQKLPPNKRSRPLTPAEYAAAMQRSEGGAPADFNGPVFPNPDHIVISDDTDSGIPDLRLPNGVKAVTGAYSGTPKLDTANPAPAQVLPAQMQTVAANTSAQQDWFAQNAPKQNTQGGDWFEQNAPQQTEVHTPEQKGILRQAWDWANKGLISGDTLLNMVGEITPNKPKDMKPGETAVDYMKRVRDEVDPDHPWLQGIKSGLAGVNLDAYNMAGSFTSPLSLATLFAGPAGKAPGAAGKAARAFTGAASVGFGAKGASDVYEAATDTSKDLPTRVQEGLQGGAMMAGGAAGAAESAKPTANAVIERTKPAARAAVKTVKKLANPENVGTVVGGALGAKVGHVVGEPVGLGAAGAYIGRKAGKAFGENFAAERAKSSTSSSTPETPVEDFEGQTSPQTESAGETPAEQVPEEAPQNAAAARAKVDTSPKKVEQLLTQATGGKKLVPGVPLKNQPTAMGLKLPEGFTPVESTAVRGYKYNPTAQEMEVISKDGSHHIYGDVSSEQAQSFQDNPSTGKAWQELRNSSSTKVAKVINGKRVPVNKPQYMRSVEVDPETGQPEFSDVLEQKRKNLQDFITPEKEAKPATPKTRTAKTKAATAPVEDDLLSKLQQSVKQVKAGKGGVMASAAPEELTKRWGVDEESLKAGREQTRGWAPMETEAELKKLEARYRKGQPVEPVMETRDANNNLIDVDGRGRAIAAKRAGVKRIPVIVRRIGVQ